MFTVLRISSGVSGLGKVLVSMLGKVLVNGKGSIQSVRSHHIPPLNHSKTTQESFTVERNTNAKVDVLEAPDGLVRDWQRIRIIPHSYGNCQW